MTAVSSPLVALALQVGRMTASDLDLPAVLGRMCTALPAATGAAAAVIMVAEPSEEESTLVASDAKARWIGEAQRQSWKGPLAGVIRTGRPLLTHDLTRLGPPELAAAAAESGLICSLAVPIVAGGQRFGGLQLLGDSRRPPEPAHGEAVQPLLDALAARLVDVRALRRLAVTPAPSRSPVDAADVATAVIPAVPSRPADPPAVPSPRSPERQPRHRRSASGAAGQPRTRGE